MKKRIWIIQLALMIILIGLILLDLLIINVPTWIVLCGIAINAIYTFRVWLKIPNKTFYKISITILTLFAICFSLFGVYCNPYWNSYSLKTSANFTKEYNADISYKKAIEDMDYVIRYVKKDHPVFLKDSQDEFTAAYEKSMSELKKCDHITVTFLWQRIQTVLSTLQDGHTYVYASYNTWHYLKYIAEMKNRGYHLIEVNKLSINDLFSEKSKLLSYETESWGIAVMNDYLQSLEDLEFLDIPVTNGVIFTYENDNGDIINKTCYEKDFLSYDEYMKYNHKEEAANKKSNFVSYSIDKEKSLAVLTLASCQYNSEYRNCLKKMFKGIKEKSIKNVVIDIRNNGGGNSAVANQFIKYLNIPTYKIPTDRWRFGFININNNHNMKKNKIYSDYVFRGKVYVLTSTSTFSSAMEFAEYIKDNRLGIIIGEAPGNDTYGYGEIATFQAPNSKLYFQVSTKQFYRADSSIKDKLVTPDIPCKSEEALSILYNKLQAELKH